MKAMVITTKSQTEFKFISDLLKKLVGHKSAYRVWIGDYRVGFFTKKQ